MTEFSAQEIGALRRQGIYRQRQKDEFFLRIRLPLGRLTSSQLDTVASVVDETERGRLELTTRQSIQIHGLAFDTIPRIRQTLEEVGLFSLGSGGKAVRNIVTFYEGGPFAGEAESLTRHLNETFVAKSLELTLPHKFKVAVGESHRAGLLFNDVGLLPVQREGGLRWQVFVGGGLGSKPHVAQLLPVEVRGSDVSSLLVAILHVFIMKGTLNQRLKFLVQSLGLEHFWELVREEWTVPVEDPVTSPSSLETMGSSETVIVDVPDSSLTTVQLYKLASVARRFTQGNIYLTSNRQILLRDVLPEEKEALLAELSTVDLATPEPIHWIACPGRTLCARGLIDTQLRQSILNTLREHRLVWEKIEGMSIHLSGCASSCARPQVADIGITGIIDKQNPGIPSVTVTVGGGLDGEWPVLGETWRSPIKVEDLPTALLIILENWLEKREGQETFRQTYLRRHREKGSHRIQEGRTVSE
ncbi:nitrite/sulfite reductase [Heliobacterium mobile]|nr:nitrite/sulfite reductase [Heliobacterium mobile]